MSHDPDNYHFTLSELDALPPEKLKKLTQRCHAAMNGKLAELKSELLDKAIGQHLKEAALAKELIKKVVPQIMQQMDCEVDLDTYGMILTNLGVSCLVRHEIVAAMEEATGKSGQAAPKFELNLNRLTDLFN